MKAANSLRARVLLVALFCVPAACLAQAWRVELTVGIAPPLLPVYEQPPIPGPGYLWTPGYWAYGEDGYYWVPGTWVLAPAPGLLWTPGYWRAAEDGFYVWNAGYWGPRIGFYGGINYGCGYFGIGFAGGYWRHGAFFYNRAVTNINNVAITNVYNTVVNRPFGNSHVSHNGGPGGVNLRASAAERLAENAPHYAATGEQRQHEAAAHALPSFRASVNHGQPPVAATSRPGVFAGHGATRAEGGGITIPRGVGSATASRASNAAAGASAAGRTFPTSQSIQESQTRGGSVAHRAARSSSPAQALPENYSAMAHPAYAHRYGPSPSAGALRRTRGTSGPASSVPRHQSQAGSPYTERDGYSYSSAARQPATHLTAPARPQPSYRYAQRATGSPSRSAQAPAPHRELARAPADYAPHSIGNLGRPRTGAAAHANAQGASHGPNHV
jgi:WXXGXW repeat (2 copies)